MTIREQYNGNLAAKAGIKRSMALDISRVDNGEKGGRREGRKRNDQRDQREIGLLIHQTNQAKLKLLRIAN